MRTVPVVSKIGKQLTPCSYGNTGSQSIKHGSLMSFSKLLSRYLQRLAKSQEGIDPEEAPFKMPETEKEFEPYYYSEDEALSGISSEDYQGSDLDADIHELREYYKEVISKLISMGKLPERLQDGFDAYIDRSSGVQLEYLNELQQAAVNSSNMLEDATIADILGLSLDVPGETEKPSEDKPIIKTTDEGPIQEEDPFESAFNKYLKKKEKGGI